MTSNQEIINEGIRLGQAMVGTSTVQAKRLELNLTDDQAEVLWANFHQARDKAYRTPRKRQAQALTSEQKARAKEIVKAYRAQLLEEYKAKYQVRNELFGMKPIPTSILRQWANAFDTRKESELREALKMKGEL